jgi:uncharacterized repeat protein (TIGR03803 family)
MEFSWIEVSAQTKIYGTTSGGGAQGAGVLYSMNTDGTNYQVLHSFQSVPDGASPIGKMVPGPGGKLYGFTPGGGALGHGIIYSWDTVAGSYQKLFDLDSVHGLAPSGDPVFFNGLLYGLAHGGGANNNGAIFSYDLSSGALADVYDFSIPVGGGPFGTITIWDSIFFFETTYGASMGNGGIMNFNPGTGIAKNLFDFGFESNGGYIASNLLLYNNMLYGTTAGGGGSRLGCIFSLDPRTGAVQDLWNFVSYFWGQYPEPLAVHNGILYGTALIGGVSGTAGTLYSLDPVSKTFTKLYDWQEDAQPTVDGASPVGPVFIDSTGVIWGQTSADGPNNAGVIFSYNINTSVYNIVFGFNWTVTGGGPRSGFILQ